MLASDQSVYGKKAGDLVKGIKLRVRDPEKPTEVIVTGTSKYVDSYPQFAEDAKGNFFPFQLGEQYLSGSIMKMARQDGSGTPYEGEVEKDNVLKIEKNQKWNITVDEQPVVTFDFSEIICESEPKD